MILELLRYYNEINQWQSLTSKQIREKQITKFNKLFHYAKAHSRFYHELYKQHGVLDLEVKSMDDIERIPIIDKKILREHDIDFITTQNVANSSKFNIRSTSGSSGEPFRIAYSKAEDYTNQARHFWSLRQFGYQPWKKILIVTRYNNEVVYPYEKDVKLYRAVQKAFPLFKRQIVSIYEPIEAIIDTINRANPFILWSTPSMLQIIAYKMQEKKVKFNIPYICVTSETVSEKMYNLFTEVFGKNLVNYYGMMESPTIGFDMNIQNKFTIFPNSSMFEFINKRVNNNVTYATPIVTNLLNYTMPIIRYNGYDIVQVDDDVDFGIKYLGKIIGRLDDILDLADGNKFVHHHAYAMFMDFHECQQYKFVQYPDKHIELQLKISDASSKEAVYQIALNKWNENFKANPIKIVFVDEFELDTENGKFKNIEKIKEIS